MMALMPESLDEYGQDKADQKRPADARAIQFRKSIEGLW